MNLEQKKVINHVQRCLDNGWHCRLIIQGAAGTGKSYTIEQMRRSFSEKINIVLASHTATASSHINGITLYKLFKFDISRSKSTICIGKKNFKLNKLNTEFEVEEECSKKMFITSWEKNPKKNILIIDEMSMVGLEMLDDIESVLRIGFGNNLPFGGVHIILVGDFFQLPPVKDEAIFFAPIEHYISNFQILILSINKRQLDKEFSDLCEGIRRGVLNSTQKRLLISRMVDNFDPKEYKSIIHIFPKRRLCWLHNMKMLRTIGAKTFYFVYSIDIKKNNLFHLTEKEQEDFGGLPNRIVISENTKVMITKNTEEYYNGYVDYIDSIEEAKDSDDDEPDKKLMEFYIPSLKDQEQHQKEFYKNTTKQQIPEFKEMIEYINSIGGTAIFCTPYNIILRLKNKKNVLSPVINSLTTSTDNKKSDLFKRINFPIQMTWAVTTHKIQGATLDEAVVDLGTDNFDPIQIYVNISRVKTIKRLYIKSLTFPIKKSGKKKTIDSFIERLERI